MGFGFRKSINLGGGFRLNFSKKGIGLSAGVKGFRASIGPSGVRMRTSIPGTGIYYEERLGGRVKKTTTKTSPPNYVPAVTQPQQIKLGLLQKFTTPAEEIAFVDGINLLLKGEKESALPKFREAIDKNNAFADAHFCIAMVTSDDDEQLRAIRSTLENKTEYGKYFKKYGISIGSHISITDELKTQITNDDLGLFILAAELYQEFDLINEAIELLERCPFINEPVVMLSLGELYFDAGRYEDSIKTLQKLENNDAVGTTALLYQGLAFREIQQYEASVEVLKTALKRKKGRSQELLLEIRYQLALTYEANGDIKKAKKEYEKIIVEDIDFKDVKEKLKMR